jgi:hypothetical protein
MHAGGHTAIASQFRIPLGLIDKAGARPPERLWDGARLP